MNAAGAGRAASTRGSSAPRPATAACRHEARGFSLIEVLVVVVIVAVAVAGITLSLVGNAAGQLETTARRVQALVQLACERAELTGVDIGWRVDGDGLRFGPLRDTGWEPLAEDAGDELRPRRWDSGMRLELRRDGETIDLAAEPRQPQLACLASGESSPFELRLAREGVAGGWRLRGDLTGRLTLEALDAPR